MEFEVNKEFEVTEIHFNYFKTQFAGIIACRENNGKYYLEILLGAYLKHFSEAFDLISKETKRAAIKQPSK